MEANYGTICSNHPIVSSEFKGKVYCCYTKNGVKKLHERGKDDAKSHKAADKNRAELECTKWQTRHSGAHLCTLDEIVARDPLPQPGSWYVWTSSTCDSNSVSNPRSWDNGTYFVNYEHDVHKSADEVYPMMIGVAAGIMVMAIVTVLFVMMRRWRKGESQEPDNQNVESAQNVMHESSDIADVTGDEGAKHQVAIQEEEQEEKEESGTKNAPNTSDTVAVREQDATTGPLEVA